MFSSISRALLAWSVNQTSTSENSVLTLKNVVKYLLTVRIVYLEQK